MKKLRQTNVDTRGVAIYARKSRITNKGDSIGVQFKQCADYARRELNLEDNYPFISPPEYNSPIGGCGQNLGPSYKKPKRMRYSTGLSHASDCLMRFVLYQ